MWERAVQTDALREAVRGATTYRQRMLRLFGIPESEIAETLRAAEREGVQLDRLEITTCLKRGENRGWSRATSPTARGRVRGVREDRRRAPTADTLFSDDGRHPSTIRSAAACCKAARSPPPSRAPAGLLAGAPD